MGASLFVKSRIYAPPIYSGSRGAVKPRAAQADGADYVAVGSMFATRSKAEFELVGPDLLRKLRGEIRVPLIGIGGITHDNVQEVVRAGADGVAVISAVAAADDLRAASERFVALIRTARGLTAPRPSL